MQLDSHHIRPLLHQLRPVITRTVENDVNLLSDGIGLSDGDEELDDIQAVDGVILPDHCTADIIQIQGTHDVQASPATRCFHEGFPTFGHPAISQLRALRRVDAINEQDGFITDFTFQLVVGFYERLLRFGTVFMWHPSRFFVAEVITVQPLVQARDGIADTPPFINQLNDSVRGSEKVIGQMADKFSRLRFAEMTVRTAIFGLEFFVIEPVMQMTTNRCFMDALRLRDRRRRLSFRRKQHAADSVADVGVTTLAL